MAKQRIQFLCSACGSAHPKWFGKCPDCGAWDTLQEYKVPTPDARSPGRTTPLGEAGDLATAARALSLDEIDQAQTPRHSTGIGELDRVLGGGIVPGSAVLVGGEPGIGKSTLLLQAAMGGRVRNPLRTDSSNALEDAKRSAKDSGTYKYLYVTSEESAGQTKMRASRLGDIGKSDRVRILAETNLERILHQIQSLKPDVVVIDSIQMIYKPDLPAAPGSVTQLRDGCMELVYLAKSAGIAMFFVGHVTKAGTLAGPKIIEHIVDTVLYFEGDRFHSHRIVRCVKNRFGGTQEIGLFEMTGSGLAPVTDPGNLFLEQYGPEGVPSGTVITAAMQGSRVLLVEVQALTAPSVVGAARRKTSGVSNDRVAMILAILEKRAGFRLAASDVFVNVAGGVKVIEPAIDLAIAMAIASAHNNRPLTAGMLAVGELGLGGEVRSVPQLELRLREAARMGLGRAVTPHLGPGIPKLGGMSVHAVRRLSQALEGM